MNYWEDIHYYPGCYPDDDPPVHSPHPIHTPHGPVGRPPRVPRYRYPYTHPWNYDNQFQRQISSRELSESKNIIRDLQKSINGEYSAIICYQLLAEEAKEQSDRRRIEEIRRDEEHHLREMSQLYTYLTGMKVKAQQTEKCATGYKQGLIQAFEDEQETVDFYNEIADKARNQYTKRIFRRAALDEQNHAVWFLRLITKQNKS